MAKTLSFVLNGEPVEAYVDPGAMLADVLRDTLGLTGTKIGCKSGDCGACTVLLNGAAVNSCMIPAGKVQGASIITIEGVGSSGKLHPIQQAFIDEGSVQCGFCTPGMILAAKALLDVNPAPGKEEIREAMSGNLCRCTGYVKIENAVVKAAGLMRESGSHAGCGCTGEE